MITRLLIEECAGPTKKGRGQLKCCDCEKLRNLKAISFSIDDNGMVYLFSLDFVQF